jgi:glyoxylase-like metal-dependent hydrolase (beta-lactamase superfamily II)
MEKIFENIYYKRFYYFNLYVIKGKDGDILIDTGFVCMKKRIKKWLDKFNIKLIILTHAHVDHTWNCAYIKKLYNCEVAIGKNDVSNLDNRKINPVPSKNKYKLWTKLMNFGMKLFVPKEMNIDTFLETNQMIERYGLKIKIIDLKGHTSGSIGIYYKDYLFAGDALVYRGKSPTIAFQNQNHEDAEESYEQIKKLNPKIIFVGHDKEIINEK